MAISADQAAELADLIPDGMHCDDARERLLCILQILLALTDSEHALSNADIRAVLRAKFGEACSPSENTVGADVRSLRESGCLGIDFHTTPSGTWCERTQLTPTKVRLLLNAVQGSRFLTVAQSNELQEDLFGLVSRHQEDSLAGEVHVDRRVARNDSPEVFSTIDTVASALRMNRKIEFTYTYSGFDRHAHPLAGDDGQTLRIETPIAIYFADDSYYVETYTPTPWRHGIPLVFSRVDRMRDVRMSEEPADRDRAAYDARRSARRRLGETFDMVEGPRRHVFLRVRGWAVNILFDRFGFELSFDLGEGTAGDPNASRLTLVSVPQAFTFYRWLSSAGDGIVISEPPAEAILRMGPWKKGLGRVTRDELLDDYHTMVDGFLAYLDRARAPYA